MVFVEAALGAGKEAARLVDVQVADVVVADGGAVVLIVAEDLERGAVEAVKAVFGTEPHKSLAVLRAAHHGIVRQPVLHLVMPEIIVVLGLGHKRQEEWKQGTQYSPVHSVSFSVVIQYNDLYWVAAPPAGGAGNKFSPAGRISATAQIETFC